MRDLANAPDTNPKWIILDGDLDANWIENMNSVMDDNRLLTLASNERIRLLPHMRMVFEIRDLVYASPATVTRAGIPHLSNPNPSHNPNPHPRYTYRHPVHLGARPVEALRQELG